MERWNKRICTYGMSQSVCLKSLTKCCRRLTYYYSMCYRYIVYNMPTMKIENARLMRMREKIIPYTFKITWVAGKTHYIADALSRYSVFGPAEENFNVDTAIKCRAWEPEKHMYKAEWEIQIGHDRAEKQRRFLQTAKWPPGQSIQKHPEQTLYR